MALLLILALRVADERRGACDDAALLCRFIEWKRAAFRVRDRLIGDPGATRIPEHLLEDTAHGRLIEDATEEARQAPATGDTTTVVAVDREGNAVSWAQSLFEEFGSGVVSPSTGIVLHNRLHLATLTPGLANTLGPGRRPFHTLCPALVVTGNRCELAIATPGDHGQPQTLAQVIIGLLERGLDVQEAIEAPRIRDDGGREVLYETRLGSEAVTALTAAGYTLKDVGQWSRLMGGVNAIHSPPTGVHMGGADPRRASYVVVE